MTLTPFHLAIPVKDKEVSRKFYIDVLGCSQGQIGDSWVDLNLFGHQLVCHEADVARADSNAVDGHAVPVPHFGVVLEMDKWQALADRLKSHDIEFIIEPYIRFAGKAGEQATMFFLDPSGNALEFKAFKDINAALFAS